jgi:hypothetical protein
MNIGFSKPISAIFNIKFRIFILSAVLFFCSCTKSESGKENNVLQITVEYLTDTTPISIKVTDQDGLTVLDVNNKYGNKTYYTDEVHSGDRLIVHYSSSVEAEANGNGMGTLQFYYKGNDRGAAGGSLGGPVGHDTIVNIP